MKGTPHIDPHTPEPNYRNGSTTAREVELISRIAQGDRKAFEELYGLYHRRLARFLTRLTKRYDVAEEVINDTFYIVWRKAGDFRGNRNRRPGFWGLPTERRETRSGPRLGSSPSRTRMPPCHHLPATNHCGPRAARLALTSPRATAGRAAAGGRVVLPAGLFVRGNFDNYELSGKHG